MAVNKTKWQVRFRTTGDILFFESFSVCGIEFQMNGDRDFLALMDLEVSHDNFRAAADLAYENLMNIFTAITLIHKGNLAVERSSVAATPIKEDTITYEIDENGNTIKIINMSADIRMGIHVEARLSKKVKMDENKICRIEKILAVSENNEHASLILTLLRIDSPYSGFNLFKIFEQIRKDCGREKLKELTPKTQEFSISDFTNSLDKPHGVGIVHSRHSISTGDISKPMGIEQCKSFLLELLDNWIDIKIALLNESKV